MAVFYTTNPHDIARKGENFSLVYLRILNYLPLKILNYMKLYFLQIIYSLPVFHLCLFEISSLSLSICTRLPPSLSLPFSLSLSHLCFTTDAAVVEQRDLSFPFILVGRITRYESQGTLLKIWKEQSFRNDFSWTSRSQSPIGLKYLRSYLPIFVDSSKSIHMG